MLTDSAAHITRPCRYPPARSVPDVRAMNAGLEIAPSHQEPQCHGNLQSRNGGGCWSDDSIDVTGRLYSRGWLRVHASETGAVPRPHRHSYAVACDRGPVDPRNCMLHANIVHQVARLEVVCSVHD